jgi:hypothetical protein
MDKKDYHKEYYNKNKEKIKQYYIKYHKTNHMRNKEHYINNKETIINNNFKYYYENKDDIRPMQNEYYKEYYIKNRSRLLQHLTVDEYKYKLETKTKVIIKDEIKVIF